jgi:HPt (histidine-containing phosphotransfer) domain-containing protein
MSPTTSRTGAVRTALDPGKLRELEALKPPVRARVLAAYRRDAPAVMSAIEAALERLDYTGVRAGAHRLKSSSGAIGAERLGELYGELEAMAMGGDLRDSTTVVAALRAELLRVLSGLARVGNG